MALRTQGRSQRGPQPVGRGSRSPFSPAGAAGALFIHRWRAFDRGRLSRSPAEDLFGFAMDGFDMDTCSRCHVVTFFLFLDLCSSQTLRKKIRKTDRKIMKQTFLSWEFIEGVATHALLEIA